MAASSFLNRPVADASSCAAAAAACAKQAEDLRDTLTSAAADVDADEIAASGAAVGSAAAWPQAPPTKAPPTRPPSGFGAAALPNEGLDAALILALSHQIDSGDAQAEQFRAEIARLRASEALLKEKINAQKQELDALRNICGQRP